MVTYNRVIAVVMSSIGFFTFFGILYILLLLVSLKLTRTQTYRCFFMLGVGNLLFCAVNSVPFQWGILSGHPLFSSNTVCFFTGWWAGAQYTVSLLELQIMVISLHALYHNKKMSMKAEIIGYIFCFLVGFAVFGSITWQCTAHDRPVQVGEFNQYLQSHYNDIYRFVCWGLAAPLLAGFGIYIAMRVYIRRQRKFWAAEAHNTDTTTIDKHRRTQLNNLQLTLFRELIQPLRFFSACFVIFTSVTFVFTSCRNDLRCIDGTLFVLSLRGITYVLIFFSNREHRSKASLSALKRLCSKPSKRVVFSTLYEVSDAPAGNELEYVLMEDQPGGGVMYKSQHGAHVILGDRDANPRQPYLPDIEEDEDVVV